MRRGQQDEAVGHPPELDGAGEPEVEPLPGEDSVSGAGSTEPFVASHVPKRGFTVTFLSLDSLESNWPMAACRRLASSCVRSSGVAWRRSWSPCARSRG